MLEAQKEFLSLHLIILYYGGQGAEIVRRLDLIKTSFFRDTLYDYTSSIINISLTFRSLEELDIGKPTFDASSVLKGKSS